MTSHILHMRMTDGRDVTVVLAKAEVAAVRAYMGGLYCIIVFNCIKLILPFLEDEKKREMSPCRWIFFFAPPLPIYNFMTLNH